MIVETIIPDYAIHKKVFIDQSLSFRPQGEILVPSKRRDLFLSNSRFLVALLLEMTT
jgi:hypothetical protein